MPQGSLLLRSLNTAMRIESVVTETPQSHENNQLGGGGQQLTNPKPSQITSFCQSFNHPDFKLAKEHFHWDKQGMCCLRTHSAVSRKDQKFKFGVQVPRSPNHMLEPDCLNGDTGWGDLTQPNKAKSMHIKPFEFWRLMSQCRLDMEGFLITWCLMSNLIFERRVAQLLEEITRITPERTCTLEWSVWNL